MGVVGILEGLGEVMPFGGGALFAQHYHRIFRQANIVEEGKNLLATDPEALLKAAQTGDMTKV